MNTKLVLVSKMFQEAQIYWVESTSIEWAKYKNFLADGVDTELWINPEKEWLTLAPRVRSRLRVQSFRPGVTDNADRKSVV